MKGGELVCLSCGHRQERKSYAKTRPRCSVCHSGRFGALNGSVERQSLKEEVKVDTGIQRIGTGDDICMPPLSKPKVKRESEEGNKVKKENKERRESWRKNELLHQQGRKAETGLIREAVEFIGSMVSEKNPRGHGSNAINHAFRIAEIKRQINDEGGDTRLLGENLRKLTGDDDSLFGLGVVRLGKGGLLGHFRRKG